MKVFGQQNRTHPLVCIAFNRRSARSDSQQRGFVCRATTVVKFGSSHALSFRFTELLALGGLLAVVSDAKSRKLARFR